MNCCKQPVKKDSVAIDVDVLNSIFHFAKYYSRERVILGVKKVGCQTPAHHDTCCAWLQIMETTLYACKHAMFRRGGNVNYE